MGTVMPPRRRGAPRHDGWDGRDGPRLFDVDDGSMPSPLLDTSGRWRYLSRALEKKSKACANRRVSGLVWRIGHAEFW